MEHVMENIQTYTTVATVIAIKILMFVLGRKILKTVIATDKYR